MRTSSYVTQCSCLLRSEEIFRDFRIFSAHFPGFSHIFRTFSVVSAIFRTFPEKILSYPHTVLKFWYKNIFVSRKPPAAHVPRAERQERHPPPVTFRTDVPAEEKTFPTFYDWERAVVRGQMMFVVFIAENGGRHELRLEPSVARPQIYSCIGSRLSAGMVLEKRAVQIYDVGTRPNWGLLDGQAAIFAMEPPCRLGSVPTEFLDLAARLVPQPSPGSTICSGPTDPATILSEPCTKTTRHDTKAFRLCENSLEGFRWGPCSSKISLHERSRTERSRLCKRVWKGVRGHGATHRVTTPRLQGL